MVDVLENEDKVLGIMKNDKNHIKSNLEIVDNEISKIEKAIQTNPRLQESEEILEAKNISFIPHMSHTSAVKSMKDFDILVLPLPFDSNYQGMPLKLLEYLSSGRIVIVAESEYIREIFNDGFYPYFYEQGNINSLHCSINAYMNEKDLERHILDGVNFASKFTWESRTKSVLNMVLI
jgi:glycosyltransferase involved in cell wall biosynthesis